MSGASQQLPLCILYLQALSVPIIAAVALWITMQQKWIAEEKLRRDVFESAYEKRFGVFEATTQLLGKVFSDQRVSETDIRTYGLRVIEARFLFDEELFQYVKQVQYHVGNLQFARANLLRLKDNQFPADEEQQQYEEISKQALDWIIKQGDDASELSTRFEPYLKRRQIERPWWFHPNIWGTAQ
jgi:hypothetical protein